MERNEALNLVKQHVKNKNLIKHMLAVEAVMGALAPHLGGDTELWRLAGLLHDIDYDQTFDKPEEHSKLGAQMLEALHLPEDLVNAVRAHNEIHGIERSTAIDKALYCSDPVTGLIVAGALIHPSRKLSVIDKDFILNRFNEKSFARGANRQTIAACSELGLTLEDFVAIALEAMQQSASELGL
ncbi:MAG: metal dependent phosphohydrolase [Bacillota bacterium]|nr:MAG: metal dependent phosphohydrolase [Bacillota bacterium]